MEQMAPYYAQVLGIGLLWVTVHCIGMCGPIMASLTAGMGLDRASTTRGRIWRATKAVVAYQSGRGLVYAALGMSAGFAGAAARAVVEGLAETAGLVVAVAILGVGLWKLSPFRFGRANPGPSRASQWTARALTRLRRLMPSTGPMRMMTMGLVLGFLPCVLMFWILGIAASTASPLHGAAIMLLLIAMTTPVLIVAACGTSLPGLFSKFDSENVIAGAMLVSGTWLLLIAMAANGWIEHMHIPFEIADRELVVMLW